MESEHLKVGIRIRPKLQSEQLEESPIALEPVISIQDNIIKVIDGDHFLSSRFDSIFPHSASQEDIFSLISPAVLQTIKGFNCTVFAYGQTGSGKTYTMFGAKWESNNPAPQVYFSHTNLKHNFNESHPLDNISGHGIIPKSISLVFSNNHSNKLTMFTSFLQIYNEKIYDLLQDSPKLKSLAIRENKLYGIFVEGLAEYIVENENDCFLLLAKGDANRVVRQTRLNHHSSRSHTIFQLLIETDVANKRGVLKKGKLNFCDLAGSEKFDKDNNMTTAHIKEMTQINKSLTTLGKVIHELGCKKSLHVPYRDSKLTRLLQDSLGLTTRTILIATISPSQSCIEETINTLKFANRAKQIMVRARKNEISALNDELVMKLQREIQHLKGLLNLKKNGGIQELQHQLLVLKEENKKLKKFSSNLTVEEVEKLRQENKRLRIELQNIGHVKENGDAFNPDSSSLNSSQSLAHINPGSPQLIDMISADFTCPICNKSAPCPHYLTPLEFPRLNISPTFSVLDSKESKTMKSVTSFMDFHKKMNVRYKMKDSLVMGDGFLDEVKENEEKMKKEFKLARSRLERITIMEKNKKKKFKEELEQLEQNKKKKDFVVKKYTTKKPQIESLQDYYTKKKDEILRRLSTNLD